MTHTRNTQGTARDSQRPRDDLGRACMHGACAPISHRRIAMPQSCPPVDDSTVSKAEAHAHETLPCGVSGHVEQHDADVSSGALMFCQCTGWCLWGLCSWKSAPQHTAPVRRSLALVPAWLRGHGTLRRRRPDATVGIGAANPGHACRAHLTRGQPARHCRLSGRGGCAPGNIQTPAPRPSGAPAMSRRPVSACRHAL